MASCGGVEWHVRPPYPKNPIFFFNLTIGSIPVGRIKMELFADISPTTADNFSYALANTGFYFNFDFSPFGRQLCTGEYSFFIACATCEWLDNKHVVFGRVPGDSLLVVRKIENVAIGPNNRPKLPCIIAECWEM